ncbi:MAG: C4-type zinc ribbon domain-containing protein [Bdellovibrionota bacterium]
MKQSVPIAEQLKVLESLQESDLKLDNLKKNRATIPPELKALEESLAKTRSLIEAKDAEIAEADKVIRQARAALELNHDRLTRSGSRLELVQNSHEFQAISKEIEQLNKLNASFTEQVKTSEAIIEKIRVELDELSVRLSKDQQERDIQASSVSNHYAQIDTDIGELSKKRAELVSKIDPRVFTQYERVRNARGGLGIVPALNGRCKGCNMIVPPQLYNQVQKSTEIYSCPSCYRMLFIPKPPGEIQEQAAVSAEDNGTETNKL